MAGKNVKFIISDGLIPSKPDVLLSDCLRIEIVGSMNLRPNQPSRLNLTVHTTSNTGRMAHLAATFDSRLISVNIPDAYLYVGPAGKTSTYAVVTPLVPGGVSQVNFGVT
jgi:hypothetical protein